MAFQTLLMRSRLNKGIKRDWGQSLLWKLLFSMVILVSMVSIVVMESMVFADNYGFYGNYQNCGKSGKCGNYKTPVWVSGPLLFVHFALIFGANYLLFGIFPLIFEKNLNKKKRHRFR
jgi:hypothetical protein